MSDEFIVDFVNGVVEAAENAAAEVPRRQALWRQEAMELSDSAFCKNYRLTKTLTIELVEILAPVTITQYYVLTKQYLHTHYLYCILCALHFFGHGSYQTPVGEHLTINMSQSSVSRCIEEVVEALNHPSVFGQWVRFPNTFVELNQIVRQFYSKYQFSGIIGAIDCTHIAIVSPDLTSFDERSYICDDNLKILNCNALFPGSTHDCHIWNNSNVLTLMERLHRNGHTQYHLIGDSGYALRPWCLTPIPGAEENTAEFRYNVIFKKARCTIDSCNGVLKARFRCLLKDRVLHYTPNKATKIINACTVLHNMYISSNLEDPSIENLGEDQLGVINSIENSSNSNSRVNAMLLQGREKQRRYSSKLF